MSERSPEQIQGEIELARDRLASAVDAIVERTSPKNVAARTKTSVREFATTPAGKAIAAGVGALVVVIVIRKVRAH